MGNHLNIGKNLTRGPGTRLEQLGIGRAGITGTSCFQQHAAVGLVAHLHPTRCHTCLLEGCEHLPGMVGHGCLQSRNRVVGPSSRYILTPWVGPPVAVMEINEYIHPQCLGRLGLGHHIGGVAEMAQPYRRVYPHTQADGVHAQLLHQRRTASLFTLPIVESTAIGLHLGIPRDVCSAPEGLPQECNREKKHTQKNTTHAFHVSPS